MPPGTLTLLETEIEKEGQQSKNLHNSWVVLDFRTSCLFFSNQYLSTEQEERRHPQTGEEDRKTGVQPCNCARSYSAVPLFLSLTVNMMLLGQIGWGKWWNLEIGQLNKGMRPPESPCNFAFRLRPGGRLLGPPHRGRPAQAGRGRGRLDQDPHLRRQVRKNDK